MENFSEQDMEDLEASLGPGKRVITIAYNPQTVTGNPESGAPGTLVHREATAKLVEVIRVVSS